MALEDWDRSLFQNPQRKADLNDLCRMADLHPDDVCREFARRMDAQSRGERVSHKAFAPDRGPR